MMLNEYETRAKLLDHTVDWMADLIGWMSVFKRRIASEQPRC
jgi:hypothetical protein